MYRDEARKAPSQGGPMAILTRACPVCDEPLDVSDTAPPGCPFAGELGCPMAEGAGIEGPLAETIAYRPARSASLTDPVEVDEGDGFPVVDDLIERTLGQYRVGQVIGRGMMARVYQATHQGLGRPCALKVMNPSLVRREPHVVERFWAEARAVAHLIHPNVVTVHNLGSDRNYHYIEMEYVPGGVSLKETVVREGPLDSAQATTYVRQVSLALEAAHNAGLVHRDVKPANVLLAVDGRAKLADFGLVHRPADPKGRPTALAGTPTFMAPELFAGVPSNPRSDLYAVGVMYYYLLTGRLPFGAETIGRLVTQHRSAPIPDVRRLSPEVPDVVAAVIRRLLAKSPASRYESAGELADELRDVLGHLRDTDELVRESLDGLGCLIQQGGRDRFRVIFPVPGDRIQEVYIEESQGRNQERLLTVYSVCAPADPKFYEFALELNAEFTHGSLSVREVSGRPMFVMTRNFSRGHVSSAEIRAAVQEIARRADRVELELTRTDVY